MYNFIKISLFLVILNLNLVDSWDLLPYGIKDNFFVSDIAIYFNRAFLTLPRKICGNKVNNPTLIEVPWKEFGHFSYIRNVKITQEQIWSNCDHIQSAISLALQSSKSKLWILDQGNQFCPPKLVAYSLFLNSFGDNALEIEGVDGYRLGSIIVEDNFPEKSRAFISNMGSNSILMVYLDTLNWQILRLIEEKQPQLPIEVDYLAFSKTNPIMYLTGKNSLELFELMIDDLNKLKNGSAHKETLTTNVTLLGYKLGKSTGLETDSKNGLFYYLVNDFAVVRWITGTLMTAETHNVLAQSFNRLPYVSKIFTGPQNGIWALINPENPQKDCWKNNSRTQEKHGKRKNKGMILKERVVKIMKFNNFFDRNFENFNDLENNNIL